MAVGVYRRMARLPLGRITRVADICGQTARSILLNGVVFTGEGKLARKATGYEREEAEAALSHIGVRGLRKHWGVSVPHRFLRRGKKDKAKNKQQQLTKRK